MCVGSGDWSARGGRHSERTVRLRPCGPSDNPDDGTGRVLVLRYCPLVTANADAVDSFLDHPPCHHLPPRPAEVIPLMRPARLSSLVVLALVAVSVAACASDSAGWTYAP